MSRRGRYEEAFDDERYKSKSYPRSERRYHAQQRGHNTTKPERINYSKERRWKEQSVKSDRFFPDGKNSISAGTTVWTRRGRAPPPPTAATDAPAAPKRRPRSESPDRRSPSRTPEDQATITDVPMAEATEPIAVVGSSNISSTITTTAAAEPPSTSSKFARSAPPPAKRRVLADETASYRLSVGDHACDIVDQRAKDAARKLLDIEQIPKLRDAIEEMLANPPAFEFAPPPLLFMRMVLAHFPSDTLQALRSLSGHRITPSGHFWAELLGGDVLNSAALRELLHQRRSLIGAFLKSRHPDATPEQHVEPATLLASALVHAFPSDTGDLNNVFRVARLNSDENKHPSIMRAASDFVEGIRRAPGRRSAVPCLELFKIAFDVFTNGLLRHFDWSSACVIGSTPLACMLPLPRAVLLAFVRLRRVRRALSRLPVPPDVQRLIMKFANVDGDLRDRLSNWFHSPSSPWRASDIDVFILADNLEEGKVKIEAAYRQIVSCIPSDQEHAVVRTPNSLTIVSGATRRNVQLLLGVGITPVDFLLYCDLDATSFAYNGRQVHALPRAVHAINTRTNLIPPSMLHSHGARSRIAKYAHRGFDAVVFELCKHWPRCDMELDATATDLMRNARRVAQRSSPYASLQGRPSDVEAGYDDVHLPTCCPVNKALMFATSHGLGVSAPSRSPMQLDELLADEYQIAASPTKLRGVRFRLHDVLSSHRADDLLLKCYQCNRRAAWDEKRPELYGLGLCADCSSLNVKKLTQWDSIHCPNKVALVTGGRVKIGFQICLRLLRSGFTVIAVTRFPNDAARRYSAEADFVSWRDKLHIYGVDLRHMPSVHNFIEAVKRRFKRLDVLINNAAQTIRRPRAYYRPLVDFESAANLGKLPAAIEWRPLLAQAAPLLQATPSATPAAAAGGFLEVAASHNALIPSFATAAPLSAALTQVQVLPCDAPERDEANFPSDRFDEHGEPIDLRDKTSWNTSLEELSPLEALEAQIVNSTVPLLLMQSFMPLLMSTGGQEPSFVVNVSSAEGQFDSSVKKEASHVHTNMAKAALNMMVRTLADELAKQRVYLSAVDTGWVTRMRPVAKSKWKRVTPAPLSDKDGAARVLDPIAAGLTGFGLAPHGVLLRNYSTVPW